jgi:transposase InsO family protein
MKVPQQIINRLIHYKKQILFLAAAKILSVVAICQMLKISRNTFYKYKMQQAQGSLGYFNCAPIYHGRAKGAEVVEKVLQARKLFPNYGKRRLASYLRYKGTSICANTVQKILRSHSKALPAQKKTKPHWKYFEAIAPNTIWSIDICYLYTKKKNGFDLYLITIMDDHSRFIVSSGLFAKQTVVEVVEVLREAVSKYGVPQTLVCDNGLQFTCSEFRRVCHSINLPIDFAPKHYPRYKAKLERFFRTTRSEAEKGSTAELAIIYHSHWINYYNCFRTHSAVLDLNHHQRTPEFRFLWKKSNALPLPKDLDLDSLFCVSNSLCSITRLVKSNRSISYKKQSFSFPQLNKGDFVSIKELSSSTDFFFNELLLLSIPKSYSTSSISRKVKRDGSVLISRQRFFLNLPKYSLVLVSKLNDSFCFFFNGSQVFPTPSQLTVQQPI